MELAACRSRRGWKLYDDRTDAQIEEVNTQRLNEIFVEFSCKWTQVLWKVNSARSYNLVYEWTATVRRRVSGEWHDRRTTYGENCFVLLEVRKHSNPMFL